MFSVGACRGVGEAPAVGFAPQAEGELQVPGVLAAAVDGCQHAAAAGEGGVVAVDGHLQLLGLAAVVVQRAVGDGLQILLAVLPRARHMHQIEVVGKHGSQRGGVLRNHRAVHPLI